MIVFLDIDGVLNDHTFNEKSQSTTINLVSMGKLNNFYAQMKFDIVLSSAWRYMILKGAMTLVGFEYMMRTHGMDSRIKIIGCTKSDEEIPSRVDQIRQYIKENNVKKYIILDDLDIDWEDLRIIRIFGGKGL